MPVERHFPERIIIPRDQDGNLPERAAVPYFNVNVPERYQGESFHLRPYYDVNTGRVIHPPVYYPQRQDYPVAAVPVEPPVAPRAEPYTLGEPHYWPVGADGRPFPAPVPVSAFADYKPPHQSPPVAYPVGVAAGPPPVQAVPVRQPAPPHPVGIIAAPPPASYHQGVHWLRHGPPASDEEAELVWQDLVQRQRVALEAEKNYRRLSHLAIDQWIDRTPRRR